MKTFGLFCLIYFSLTGVVKSQIFYLYGDKTYGGFNGEDSGNIIRHNNEIVLSGRSFSNISGDKTDSLCNPSAILAQDIWILKIDTAFNIVWQKDIGGNGSEKRPFIAYSQDSLNIIFSCYSESDSSCSKSENNRSFPQSVEDYWVGKLDISGNIIWEKTLGGNGTEEGVLIRQLSTGNFIVSGTSASPISGDKTHSNYGLRDFWLVELDSMGNKIWDNVYGGVSDEFALNGEFDLLPTNNGNFILAGKTLSSQSGNISDTNNGGADVCLFNIDGLGNINWDKLYGGSGSDRLTHISPTSDNGFIICGATASPQGFDVSDTSRGGISDYWVFKIDSTGNKLWDKRYGGNKTDLAYWVEEAPDGGFWVAGNTNSNLGGEVSEPPFGINDYWILRLDSVGNKLWDKRFGGPGNNILTSFSILSDSSIMLFGNADSGLSTVKSDIGKGPKDYWLVHFYYGNNPPLGISEISNSQGFSIYPNPATTEITIGFTSNDEKTISISDISGKAISQCVLKSTSTIDISKFSPGVYLCRVTDKNKNSFVRKFLKY